MNLGKPYDAILSAWERVGGGVGLLFGVSLVESWWCVGWRGESCSHGISSSTANSEAQTRPTNQLSLVHNTNRIYKAEPLVKIQFHTEGSPTSTIHNPTTVIRAPQSNIYGIVLLLECVCGTKPINGNIRHVDE